LTESFVEELTAPMEHRADPVAREGRRNRMQE